MKVKKQDITNEDLNKLVGAKIIGLHLDDEDSDFVNCFILQTDKGSFRISLDDGGATGTTHQHYEIQILEDK